MKLTHYTSLFLLGLLTCLLSPLVTCDSLPTHYYNFVKDSRDPDGTHHIFAHYPGRSDSYSQSKIIRNLEMIVSFHEKNTFRVKVLDADSKRWEIPEQAPFPHFESNDRIPHTDSCCEVHIEKDPFFGFYITRKDTNTVIFDTRNRQFVFSDLYIEFSTALPSDNVFGFGERNSKFKLTPGTYTIWGRDDPMILENGYGGGNTYSHHPVGLVRDKTGNFFMTLMRNSNAMDVIIENKNNVPGLTYKIVGGVIDLVFFIGDDYPDTLLKSYHAYLGNYTMMPFWSMGYHQSKWGYTDFNMMNDVVTKYIAHGIPLDVIWSDIDYMIGKEIFTVNTASYPPEKMRQLTTVHKKKWVPIIDPGVKHSDHKGPGTQEGLKRDIFLKNHKGDNLVGYVWPGKVYFPDFFNPNTEGYWGEMLEVLHKIIPFAGIWLDMNEVANFVDGEDKRPDWEKSVYDTLPYTPGSHPLKRKTISLDAVHYNNAVEYDTHSLFSLMENAATHKFLETKSKLPFILTRSTSMGVGRYAAHWTGDNGAHWKFLQHSIPGNFNFQIFGIPFVGADICGFMDGTNEELCARWTQVGALYPFARNHHEERTRSQEPWTFSGSNHGVSVIETTRASIKTRYSILKWYYSLFVETRGGGSIFRPLVFEFPHDEELYQDGFGDWEFLLGKSVLCTPKVEAGEPFVNAYFPQATWYDLFTGQKVMDSGAAQRTKRVEAPFNASAPMFLRGGHVVHRQNVDNVLSTEDLNNEFELIVGLEKSGEEGLLSAKGSMMGIETYDDDSVFHRCMEDNCLYDITVTVKDQDATSATIEVKFERQDKNVKVPLDGFDLNSLRLYGLPLEYMMDDEEKIGYGLVQLVSSSEGNSSPVLVDLVPVEADAFSIAFNGPIRVQEGDVLRIELMI